MAEKRKTVIRLYQRTNQGLTFTKNRNFTQTATVGEAITVYLYDEDSFDTLTGGLDVTTGSPTGAAEDTDITLTLDTLTGITLTGRKRYAVYAVGDNGTVFLPNKTTADIVILELLPYPS